MIAAVSPMACPVFGHENVELNGNKRHSFDVQPGDHKQKFFFRAEKRRRKFRLPKIDMRTMLFMNTSKPGS